MKRVEKHSFCVEFHELFEFRIQNKKSYVENPQEPSQRCLDAISENPPNSVLSPALTGALALECHLVVCCSVFSVLFLNVFSPLCLQVLRESQTLCNVTVTIHYETIIACILHRQEKTQEQWNFC